MIPEDNMLPNNDESVNEIQLFNFNDFKIRAITKDGEPWFVATDIAKILEYRDANTMFKGLEDDERGVTKVRTLGGPQEVTIVNESGLYSAILRANKPEAKQFKKWVTSEVLPQIRKTGSYISKPKELTKLEAYKLLVELEEEKLKLQKENDVLYIESQTQKHTLDYQQPFVEHSQSLRESKSLIPTSILAATEGIEVSAQTLNKFLNKEGVIWRVGGAWILTADYKDKGYGKLVTHTHTNSNSEKINTSLLKWYEEGRAFVLALWKKRKSEAEVKA